MSNMENFLKSEMPTMLLGAIMEAAKEVAQEEKDAKGAKQTTEESVKNNNSKVLTLSAVKNAAQTIGEEDCKSSEKMAASVFYTYASFIAAGFSSREAFELVKVMLM